VKNTDQLVMAICRTAVARPRVCVMMKENWVTGEQLNMNKKVPGSWLCVARWMAMWARGGKCVGRIEFVLAKTAAQAPPPCSDCSTVLQCSPLESSRCPAMGHCVCILFARWRLVQPWRLEVPSSARARGQRQNVGHACHVSAHPSASSETRFVLPGEL
jgi:hypothetical protein